MYFFCFCYYFVFVFSIFFLSINFSKRLNATTTTTATDSTQSSSSLSSSQTTTTTYQRQQLLLQQQQQNYLNKTNSTNNNNNNVNPRRSWSSIAFNNKNFPDGKLGYESNNNIGLNDDNGTKNKYLFTKGITKFERSSQDVMARASQIVQ